MQITKSNYMNFLRHPAWLWLEKNDKSKLPPHDAATMAMFAGGYKFEDVVEKLFPEALKLSWESYDEYRELATVTAAVLKNQSGPRTVVQAKFEAGNFACISDIVHVDGKLIDVYEIKSSTQVKKAHLFDLAFQCEVIRQNGYEIRSVHVLTVNTEYVRSGSIEPSEMVNFNDVTELVLEKEALTHVYMQEAFDVASLPTCPDMSPAKIGPVGSVSEWLPVYKYAVDLPEYSIYDLASPGAARLKNLEAENIRLITEIPESFNLTAKQEMQVLATKQGSPIINTHAISAFMEELTYPLYFLDYETYSGVIPYFDGQRPYMQVPFQYSLHIIDSPGAELRHVEYLQSENRDCVQDLSESLRIAIGTEGSVITWNMSFERSCNTTMGKLAPAYKEFYEQLNARIVDLCIPFKDDMYVDARFKGSYSIKSVLPVLVPELSYKELEIQNGGSAQTLWMNAVLEENNELDKNKILKDLLEYCKLDTLAMVEIWKVLQTAPKG